MKLIRINKYLSEVGFCSRREADALITAKRITINGLVPEIGTKVTPSDIVCVDGKPVKAIPKERIYIAYNKPIGITCTTDLQIKGNIIDAISHPKRIFPIGRLDKPSEGLILLTDDGDIVNKILRANNNHEKEYIVSVNKDISKDFIKKMSAGIPILNTVTNPCKVVQLSSRKFKIILTQGLNRQIRRMCEHLNYNVETLKRVRIMNITLNIPNGKWRDLTNKELHNLNKLLKDSTKTHNK
jgi:23S rRNA pseudouridine2604 synthase